MSHKYPKVDLDFIIWVKEKYCDLKPVKVKCGTRYEFIGIVSDFGLTPGSVHIIQKDDVLDMV